MNIPMRNINMRALPQRVAYTPNPLISTAADSAIAESRSGLKSASIPPIIAPEMEDVKHDSTKRRHSIATEPVSLCARNATQIIVTVFSIAGV